MRDKDLQKTKHLMAALGRMPPKPHDEMKLGKTKPKRNPGKAVTKPTKTK
jgi:hypothetical protein